MREGNRSSSNPTTKNVIKFEAFGRMNRHQRYLFVFGFLIGILVGEQRYFRKEIDQSNIFRAFFSARRNELVHRIKKFFDVFGTAHAFRRFVVVSLSVYSRFLNHQMSQLIGIERFVLFDKLADERTEIGQFLAVPELMFKLYCSGSFSTCHRLTP